MGGSENPGGGRELVWLATCPVLNGRATTIEATPLAEATRRISQALDGRDLHWVGTRGEDAIALAGVDQLRGSFSLMAPPTAAEEAIGRPLTGAALESIEGRRRERDAYAFDGDEAPADAELQRRLVEAIDREGDAVLLTYGPSRLAAAAALRTADAA